MIKLSIQSPDDQFDAITKTSHFQKRDKTYSVFLCVCLRDINAKDEAR